jgi:hypothetical protein
VLDGKFAIAAVEISHLAGPDMGGADGQARPRAIDPIEVDELAKRLQQRRGRIIAGAVGAKRIAIPGVCQWIGFEKTGNAARHRRPIGQFLVEAGKGIVKIPDRILLYPLPEIP